ncbi:hypothetical protein C5B42_03905 [Candidatus Cerribacteria bacterium 'Amazon FNV 2010 28 9']|uniref:DUF2029 domain-containing protein n=1 Tax=Candidatus Cerribacteria bacterium 'Amazon FNV 2010 28 9' TaxID=2081795 RepID=A0A317JN82_9BACT|nr:MAG: hypothetical protein C5B42_03905 [Candidatus Cerribacteria bacterium 'Amazon FNV 2010 28 9']
MSAWGRVKKLLLLLLVLLHLSMWVVLSKHFSFFHSASRFIDFDAYYKLAQDIRMRLDPYTVVDMQTLGPPLMILPFVPFSFLPLHVGSFIFFLLNLAAGYMLCWLLSEAVFPQNWKGVGTLFLSLLFFLFFPTRFGLVLGQVDVFVALLCTLLLVQKQQQLLIVWLTVILKSLFVFLFIPLFLKSKRKVLFTIFNLVCIACTFLYIRPQWYMSYLRSTFSSTLIANQPIARLDYYNQSIKSTVHRTEIPQLYPWVLLLLVPCFLFFTSKQSTEGLIIVSLLVSPVVWQHYFTILFPIFVMLWTKVSWRSRIVLLICALSCAISVDYFNLAQPTFIRGVFASHGTWALLILVAIIVIHLRSAHLHDMQ